MSALDRAQRLLDQTVRQTYHEEDGKTVVNTYQDVEPHLEYAAKCRREEWERRGQFGKREDWHRTMCVPFNIISVVAQRLGIPQGRIFGKEEQQRIMREIKGPEFSLFRVTSDKRI